MTAVPSMPIWNRTRGRAAMIVVVGLLLASITVGQAGESRPAAERMGTIRGHVVDRAGKPIANATVKLTRPGGLARVSLRAVEGPTPMPVAAAPGWRERRRQTTHTDEQGAFSALVQRGQTYWIHVDATGYVASGHAGLRANGPELTVVLDPGCVLRGHIVSRADASPVRGAFVSAGGEGAGKAALSRDDGSFTIEDLPATLRWIEVEHRDFIHVSRPGLVLDPWTGGEITIALDRGLSVTGIIVDAGTGNPIAGAPVAVGDGGIADLLIHPLFTTTDTAGRFRFGGLPPATATLQIDAPGHRQGLVPINLLGIDGELSLGSLPVAAAMRIEMRLVDESKAPVADAELECGDIRAVSDGDGVAILDGLVAPIPPVSIHADTCEDEQWHPALGAEDATSRPVVVLRSATGEIRGRVLADRGTPLAGAKVTASGSNFVRETWTEPDGTFRFGAVAEGRWDVSAAVGENAAPDPVKVSIRRGERRDGLEFHLGRVLGVAGVLRDRDGEPVRNAQITWSNPAASGAAPARGRSEAGPDGSFRFTIPIPTPFSGVAVTAPGYEAKAVSIEELVRAEDRPVILDRLPGALRIKGFVLDQQTREPIAGASVSVTPLSTPSPEMDPREMLSTYEVQRAPTGRDGKFELMAPAGLVRIKVDLGVVARADTYVGLSRELVLSPSNEAIPLELELDRGQTLIVRTRTAVGETATRFQAVLTKEADERTRWTLGECSGPACEYVFAHLAPGRYQIVVLGVDEPCSGTGALRAIREHIDLGEGVPTELDLPIAPMGILAVTWNPADDTSQDGDRSAARLEVSSQDGQVLDVWNRPDMRSRWEMMKSTSFTLDPGVARRRHLPPGSYLVRFHHPQFDAPDQTVTIRSTEEVPITIDARRRQK